jgi:hypothetical protein
VELTYFITSNITKTYRPLPITSEEAKIETERERELREELDRKMYM